MFYLNRFVPGAGATEIELAQRLLQFADTLPGLEQYAVRKFAVALESIPRALADNSGANATEVVNNIYKSHRVTSTSKHELNYPKNHLLKFSFHQVQVILLIDIYFWKGN